MKTVELIVETKNRDILNLQDIEAAILQITRHDMKQRKRDRSFVGARGLFFYLASKYTSCNLSTISRYIGMNHASVIYHLKNIEYTIPQDPELQTWYDYITSHLDEIILAKSGEGCDHAIDTMNILEKVEFLMGEVARLSMRYHRLDSNIIKHIELKDHEKVKGI